MEQSNRISLNKRQLILFFASIIAFFAFLVCVFNLSHVQEEYKVISILPLVYSLSSLILSYDKNVTILKVLCILCYSIKLLLIPFLIFISGDVSYQDSANYLLSGYIEKAVFLQFIEIVGVTVFLILYKDKSVIKHEYLSASLNNRAKKWIWALFITALILIGIYPQFLLNFQPVVFFNNDQFIVWAQFASTVKESIPIYIYYLGGWVVSTAKLLLPYCLIIYIYKLKRMNSWTKIIISVVIIILSCAFTTSDRASTIFTGVTCFILLNRIYTDHSSAIMRFLLIGGGAGIFAIFIHGTVSNSSNFIASLASKLNAYFAGTFNVSAVFLMDNSNKLDYLCGDILRSIPLLKGFFTSWPMSYLEYNKVLAVDTEYNSQILPAIGQGYFYLGYLGAILFPIISLRVSFYLHNRIQQVNDSLSFFVIGLVFMYVFLGIFLYDTFLSFSLVLNTALPMIIIMKLSKI